MRSVCRSGPSTLHDCFNFPDFFGDVSRKQSVSCLRHENIVFDSYSKAPEFRLYGLSICRNVDSRLDCDDHAGLQLKACCDIVHVDTKRMRNPVTDERSVPGFSDDRPSTSVKVTHGYAGFDHLDDLFLGTKDNLVDLALRLCEF